MGPAQKRVLDALPESPDSKTIGELVSGLGISYSTVRAHLKSLLADDKVLRARDGATDIYCRIDGEFDGG